MGKIKLVSLERQWHQGRFKKGLHEVGLGPSPPTCSASRRSRARPEQIENGALDAFAAFEKIWNPADRPGYSGTAVFTKMKPKERPHRDRHERSNDTEGRVITCDFRRLLSGQRLHAQRPARTLKAPPLPPFSGRRDFQTY
jgi:exodeoxyribonuclease-3